MKVYKILYLAVIPLLFCQATVWYVGQGGLPHIQDGLDSCTVNDTVLVGPGVYNETLVWPDVQGICLMSEKGVDSTKIFYDWQIVIYYPPNLQNNTTVMSFHIERNQYEGREEPVIWCYRSSPTLSYNNIKAEFYCGFSGGILCQEGSPIIHGNDIFECGGLNFDRNFGGGLVCIHDSSYIHNNKIRDARVDYGGGVYCHYSIAMLYRNEIINNTVDSCGGGVLCKRSSPVISHCNIRQNSYDGVYCCEGSSPIIHFCNIENNDMYGVRNIDSYVTVDARYNWWGDSTGPYHPVLNPGGLGDAVSDNVLFEPWLREPVGIEETEIAQQQSSLVLSIYPNPSKGITTFDCVLGDRIEADLTVYNALGQVVRQYIVTTGSPYHHSMIEWDGRDRMGKLVPNGIYFAKLSTSQHVVTRKVILMR